MSSCADAISGHAACPRCGRGTLHARHCKQVCEACGYVESCEDLFPPLPIKPRKGPHANAAAENL